MKDRCRCRIWEIEEYTHLEYVRLTRRVVSNILTRYSESEVVDEEYDSILSETCSCTRCGGKVSIRRMQFWQDYGELFRCDRERGIHLLFDRSSIVRGLASYLLRRSPYCRVSKDVSR